MKITLTNKQVNEAALRVCLRILELNKTRKNVIIKLYGVPRGGVPASYLIKNKLTDYNKKSMIVSSPEGANYIVDDIIDSGATRDRYLKKYPTKHFLALYEPGFFCENQWIVFPWEQSDKSGVDSSADDIPIRLLQYIGEDVNRGGLIETPKRFLAAWKDWTSGYGQNPADILKVFDDGGEKYDQMVLLRDIPVYSHCEHHLTPFFGVAHVAYIPDGRIVGLSKLSRLVDVFSKRLQVQERLTSQIAETIQEVLSPRGVAVSLSCRHLCMESRGVQRSGSTTITQALKGAFLTHGEARAEFMACIK